LKQIQTTYGANVKKQAIQSKAREHNLPIEETKAKVFECKEGLLLAEKHFGSVDLLTN
jgi:hypothetical protein